MLRQQATVLRLAVLIFYPGRIMPLACVFCLLLAGADLSGTWKMDPSRSESAHQAVPIGAVVLVVRQTATSITLETRRHEASGSEV